MEEFLALPDEMDEFSRKYGSWAVVTGASSGIGEAFSRELAARKINLVLVARRKEKLEVLAQELAATHGIEVTVLTLDLGNPDSLERLIHATASLDVGLLVNNAGFALTGDFLSHTIEEESALFYVNCRAPLTLTHAFSARMVARGKGGIINVASSAGLLPMPNWSQYAASKAYLLHLSEGLWFELRGRGVDILALCPGATRTEFSQVAGTKLMGMEAADVVDVALNNLGKRASVVPGLSNRLSVLFTRFLPRQWLIRVGASVVDAMALQADR